MISDSERDLPELMEVVMLVNFVWTKIMDLAMRTRAKAWSRSIFCLIDIQKFMGIGHAKLLQELYLNDIFFYGGTNPIIYKLPQLKILHVEYSGLKGKIPQGLSKLANLNAFNL